MAAKPHPKPTLALVALLALASALGVTVAIVLAGVAMLLAAPAYAASAEVHEARLLLRAVMLKPQFQPQIQPSNLPSLPKRNGMILSDSEDTLKFDITVF